MVGKLFAVVELQLSVRAVEAHGRTAQAQLDVLLGVEALLVYVDLLAPSIAAEVVLRQRRTLVRAFIFRADQHDASVEPLLAKRFGRFGTGEAGADDHVRLLTTHGNPSW